MVGAIDPNPRVSGRGSSACASPGFGWIWPTVSSPFAPGARTRSGAPGSLLGRPFVTYKVAATLDGRVTLPGSRWLSGEASRRLVHELRAASDAVAVGMGTVLADAPRLDARASRSSVSHGAWPSASGQLPEGSQLELRSGPLDEELAALAAEGVQSLLLEGGPTLATAFLEAGLVDKLLVFVTPHLGGAGPRLIGDLSAPLELSRLSAEPVGEDVLISAYVHEP